MSVPFISVVIPLYNKEKDILKTLESVLNQTFDNFEIVIVDDGSTDNSLAVVKQFTDPRIQLFEKDNEGVATTRNKGIALSKAPYIAFLDADDYWYPNHLEVINQLITDFPENSWYATSYYKQYSDRVLIEMFSPLFKTNFNRGPVQDFFVYSIVDSLAWTSAVVFNKIFLKHLDGFDVKITHGAGEDIDLWIRAALKSSLVFSREFTAVHKLHALNRISNTKTQLRNFLNLDVYESQTGNVPGLKKYLDLNRFSIALQYKMAGDIKTYKNYLVKIDPSNLNQKQKLLLKLPKTILLKMAYLKNKLQTKGIYLTAFK